MDCNASTCRGDRSRSSSSRGTTASGPCRQTRTGEQVQSTDRRGCRKSSSRSLRPWHTVRAALSSPTCSTLTRQIGCLCFTCIRYSRHHRVCVLQRCQLENDEQGMHSLLPPIYYLVANLPSYPDRSISREHRVGQQEQVSLVWLTRTCVYMDVCTWSNNVHVLWTLESARVTAITAPKITQGLPYSGLVRRERRDVLD